MATFTPTFLYQIHLRKDFLQLEFSPKGDSAFLLHKNGDLECLSSTGEKKEGFSLPFTPELLKLNHLGNLLAVLGEGKLAFVDLASLEISTVNVDPRHGLLEFSNQHVVLGGFHPDLIFCNRFGRVVKRLKFDSFIRHFKVAPRTKSLILYNRDLKIVCADMEGKVRWQTEWLKLQSEIVVTQGGIVNYCLIEKSGLMQFHLPSREFFRLDGERQVKQFTASNDGNYLLLLDIQNRLKLYDRDFKKLWEQDFQDPVSQVQMSPTGNLFAVLDAHRMLTCFSLKSSQEQQRGEFLEIKQGTKIVEKEIAWSKKPGSHNPTQELRLLSVNSSGNGIGLLGLNGAVHFLDQQGETVLETKFPASVEYINIHHSGNHAEIYGERQVKVCDLSTGTSFYIPFDLPFWGRPLVNFFHQKVFLITKEKELYIYHSEGKLEKSVKLKGNYRKGVSCDSYGIVLFDEKGLACYSETGELVFSSKMRESVKDVFYHQDQLWLTTESRSLLRLDLPGLKGKKKRFAKGNKPIRILSMNPLLVFDGGNRVLHLDDQFSVLSQLEIRSPSSLFMVENRTICEIIKERNGFYCYDAGGNTLWRYRGKERITEWAITANGLFFLTSDSIQFIALKPAYECQRQFSQFLEI